MDSAIRVISVSVTTWTPGSGPYAPTRVVNQVTDPPDTVVTPLPNWSLMTPVVVPSASRTVQHPYS